MKNKDEFYLLVSKLMLSSAVIAAASAAAARLGDMIFIFLSEFASILSARITSWVDLFITEIAQVQLRATPRYADEDLIHSFELA